MPDDIDRDHPEFEVWNSSVGQAPSNFRARLDPNLQGQVEDRSNDPQDPLSKLAMYLKATPGKFINDHFPPAPPTPPWSGAGSLADQAGRNDIGRGPHLAQPAAGVPQSMMSNQVLQNHLQQLLAHSNAVRAQRQVQQQQDATRQQIAQLKKELFEY